MEGPIFILYSVGHYPNTALFLITPQKKNPEQGSGLSSLGRIMLKKQGCVIMVYLYPCFCPKRWQIFQTGCSTIFVCPVDRSWCAQRCCDGAATESLLRRSRCCDGDAQTSSVALILRVASRRNALNEEPASFSLLLIQISSRGPQS